VGDGRSMYRILTERRNPERVKAMLRRLSFDYTVIDAQGSWMGHAEDSMVIELDGISRYEAKRVARLIKSMNDQSAVLLQVIPVSSLLI
jgi:hypothetical protein